MPRTCHRGHRRTHRAHRLAQVGDAGGLAPELTIDGEQQRAEAWEDCFALVSGLHRWIWHMRFEDCLTPELSFKVT